MSNQDFKRCGCGTVFLMYGAQTCTCHQTSFFNAGKVNTSCGTCFCKSLAAKREAYKPAIGTSGILHSESEEQRLLREEFHGKKT